MRLLRQMGRKNSACAGQNDLNSSASGVGKAERRNRRLVQRSLNVGPEIFKRLLAMASPDDEGVAGYQLEEYFAGLGSNRLSAADIEFLSWVGTSVHWLHSDSPWQQYADIMTNYLNVDPQRYCGLMPILICLAESGAKVNVSEHALDSLHLLPHHSAVAALALRATSDHVSQQERLRLIAELAELINDPFICWRALAAVRESNLKGAVELIVDLLRHSKNGKATTLIKAEATETLSDFLSAMSSGLQDDVFWADVALPKRRTAKRH